MRSLGFLLSLPAHSTFRVPLGFHPPFPRMGTSQTSDISYSPAAVSMKQPFTGFGRMFLASLGFTMS